MSLLKQVTIGLIVIILILLGITCSSYIYNYHFHPLARLADQISSGNDLDNARKLFEKYKHTHNNNDVMQYSDRFPDNTCDYKKRENVKGCLFLYDESIFHNVQLAVFFDRNGKVVDKLFVGD
jgi:hypothetical protein